MSTPLLDDIYNETQGQIAKTVKDSSKVTIISDGWSNIRCESVINIILATPEPVFYKFIEASKHKHTAAFIASVFNDVIDELGKVKCLMA